MKISSTRIQYLFLAFALMMSVMSHAASWTPKAKQLFEDGKYEECIELTESYSKENQAAMFLAFSHLEEGVFNNSKYDKEKHKAYITRLESKMGIDDMENLLYFVSLTDKPYVVKDANKLVGKIFKSINDIDDVPKLIPFLKVDDEDTRKLALAAIERILKPKRDYVTKGGTLREKDVTMMSSKQLITALMDQIENSSAKSSLLLIEEPALAYLGESQSIEATKLEAAINKKIAARQKKYPESTWDSALGKKR